MFRPGDCFQIVSGVYEDGRPKRHTFVVVTDFDKETRDAITVSFSSTKGKPYIDKTTVIPAGSHDFITEESYAAYYRAARMTHNDLDDKVNRGLAIQGKPISERLLFKLRAGIMASKETPMSIKIFYQDCLYRGL